MFEAVESWVAEHADLEDQGIRRGSFEDEQGGERVEFEKGQCVRPKRVRDTLERHRQRGHRRPLATDADALRVVDEMRGGECPGAIAAGAQHRVGKRDTGSLAVRPSYGDHRAARRNPAAALCDAPHALEPRLDRLRVQRKLPVEPCAEVVEADAPRHLRRAQPRPPGVADWSAGRSAPRCDRAGRGGPRSCRWRRARAGTRCAGILRGVSPAPSAR